MKFFTLSKKPKENALKPKLSMSEQALHDWKLMLLVFVIVVIVAVLLDGYVFMKVNEGNFFSVGPESEVTPAPIGQKTLLDANTFFESRQKEYDAFKASAISEIDPSL